MAVTNEELVQKAGEITTEALDNGGKLSPKQSDKFIDFIIDETSLRGNVRIHRFRNESMEIDKIGVGKRVTVPKAEAVDPGVRFGVTTSKIQITPKVFMTPFDISDEFREINIEGDSVEDTVIRMMSAQVANDLEELDMNGNKLGLAAIEADLRGEGFSTTDYIRDSFLGTVDGWSLLADGGNVVDADGANIGLSVFGQAIRSMPTKFRRNKKNLRWLLSADVWQIMQEKLATRATGLGDSAAGGSQEAFAPFGIKAVPVPLWDFEPQVVEHVALNGTTPAALKNKNVKNVTVLPDTLAKVPIAAWAEGAGNDYVLDAANGTIAREGAGAIPDGATVKVTYESQPQMMLTHMSNLILAIGRDIRIEKDRDIHRGLNEYAITTKIDVAIEELDALVKVRNIGTGI